MNQYSKGVFFNTYPKNKHNWKKQINFINSLKRIEHVEVWIEEELTNSELKLIKSLLKKYKIIIHGPFVHLSLISPHSKVRETTIKVYLDTLKAAEFLGANLVTFHCGTRIKFAKEKDDIKIFVKNFKELENKYKGNIAFTIENLPDEKRGVQIHYPKSLKDFIHLKKLIPSLNFTLDVGHVIQGGEDLRDISNFLNKHKNSVLDIHLHDGITNKRAHLGLGDGEFNIKGFFNLLRKISYNKYVSLETITKDDTKKSWGKFINYEPIS